MIWFLTLVVYIVVPACFLRLQKRLREMEQRLESLEQGVVPNHEQAKAAATAMNDFHAGIAGILGYDPFEVKKTAKE